MQWAYGQYMLSDETDRMQLDAIADMLSRSYWAPNRPREVIAQSIGRSVCLGAFESDRQVAFARVVTDGCVFGWLCDVIVHEDHRGRGLGKQMMRILADHPVFGVRLVILGTRDAHGLYEQFGFRRSGDRFMMRIKPDPGEAIPPRPVDALRFVDADGPMRDGLAQKLNAPGRHRLDEHTFHHADGFTIVAMDNSDPVGVISIAWRTLPPPLGAVPEAFIDLIDVDPPQRRRGIARRLLDLAADRARRHGAVQLRAWSGDDRPEAIAMWHALGFALCPADIQPQPGLIVHGFHVAKRLD